MEIIRFRRPRKQRYKELRSGSAMATKMYYCDHCRQFISPGDTYDYRIMATEITILTFRKHRFPKCPSDPDEEDRELEKLTRQAEERDKKEKASQKIAA